MGTLTANIEIVSVLIAIHENVPSLPLRPLFPSLTYFTLPSSDIVTGYCIDLQLVNK